MAAGVAWSPQHGISGVQVRTGDGEWRDAAISEPLADTAWVQWQAPFELPAGTHEIQVRAIDGSGATQTAATSSVRPDGATGHHRVRVRVA